MSNPRYILYDIPNKTADGNDPTCWSPNVWKARLVLNLKGLDYETRWLEFPDIEKTIGGELKLPPIEESPWRYTLPVVTDSSTSQSIMESHAIAQYLEAAHPSPSLHLTSPTIARVDDLVARACRATFTSICHAIVQRLNAPSADYYERTRSALFGMSMAEVQRTMGGKEAWPQVEALARELGDVLRERKEGPFVLGRGASWADIIVVAMLQQFSEVDEAYFERFVGCDGALRELYDAFGRWLQRKD